MADLRGDAVTIFLFTDIEGSTGYWEDRPAAMQLAVAQHDQLLHAAIASHHGHVFKTTGDGFQCAFPEPLAAVRAALAIQQAVQANCWGEIGQLRVRVALHQGPSQQRDSDYFGQTLNRVARLVSATEGGEILVSEGIAEAVRRELPAGASLVSLGELRLRDLREPLRVYRLTGPAEGAVNAATEVAPPTPAPAQRDGLRIFVLGSFRIEGVSGALANDGWSRRKARQLLKCLLSRPSRRLTRDEAYELFWPNSDVAPSNLRVVLHALRQALAGLGVDRPDELVVSDHDGVAFNSSGIWVDADAFERLAAPLHDAAASDDDLEAAARLYAGEFLADDPYELWATARRDHLRRLWGDVLLELSHRRERRGEIELAAAALERRLAADPCDELAAVELMRLWARHGRRTDALRAYRRLADALLRELVVEPGAEAMRLRDHILAGKIGESPVSGAALAAPAQVSSVAAVDVAVAVPDALAGPSASAPAPPAPAPPAPAPHAAAPHAPAAGTPAPPFEPSYPFPVPARLVGRQPERAALDQIIEQGRTGGQVMLIGGSAGVGKSALAGALVREARARGYLCLVGGSFEQDCPLPLGSIRDALGDYLLAQEPHQVLSELGGMVTDLELIIPELRYHLGLPGDGAARQLESNHLLSVVHSCLRVLATRRPVLLCLEDLHAADSATIAALPYFGRQFRRLPVTVLGTYCTDEMPSDHRLARLLPKLVRERMVDEMRLRPLAREETAQLTTALLGGAVEETVICWLHGMTEGNPLLSELLLLALCDEGRLVQRPDSRWGAVTASGTLAAPQSSCPLLPPAALAVLERRLAPLDAGTREVLDTAAVLGQTFDLAALAEALGADRAVTVGQLETLMDARLLRESGAGYRFEQPLLREARLQRMSVHRRAALEARAQRATGEKAVHGPRSSTSGNGWHPRLPLLTGG